MLQVPINLVAVMSIALSVASAGPASAASAIGMLTQVRGQVFVQRGTAKVEARLADLLYAGDVLITGAGEAVIIYCPSSERMSIPGNATLELQADGVKVLKGAAPAKAPAKCLLPRVALGKESLERVGAFRARGYPPIVQYLGGPITASRPTFAWEPIERATAYRLTLKDAEREEALWETQTTLLTISYPDSRPPLQAGSYVWEVRAEGGGEILAQGTASIDVKPNADLSKAGAGPEAELTRALEFENAGYYAEAAAYFRKLREASPQDARLIRHLAWLYWNAGLIEAFNEEWKRLDVK